MRSKKHLFVDFYGMLFAGINRSGNWNIFNISGFTKKISHKEYYEKVYYAVDDEFFRVCLSSDWNSASSN
jgi:hypothetical protein